MNNVINFEHIVDLCYMSLDPYNDRFKQLYEGLHDSFTQYLYRKGYRLSYDKSSYTSTEAIAQQEFEKFNPGLYKVYKSKIQSVKGR